MRESLVVTTVVVGVDAGGTSTRGWACDFSGAVLGVGRADGANVRSAVGDPETNLAAAIGAAVDTARTSTGRRVVCEAVCVGIAGTEARREEVEALVARAVARVGVEVTPLVVPDLEIAFRSVSPHPSGRLLLAGTGALAAGFTDWATTSRRDGLGWLLGDAGSGVWIGRRVLRAAATHLDGGAPTSMTPQVLTVLGLPTDTDDPQQLVRATDDLSPAAWGRCAPAALAHAADDDIARRIVDDAAAHLLASLAGLRESGGPVVLAGGLLEAGPLRERIDAAVTVAGHADQPVIGACIVAAASRGIALSPRDLTHP